MPESSSPCRFLEPARPCRCALVEGNVVPSLHERERHCYPGLLRDCRVLRTAASLGRPLRESEYYTLWLSPPREPADETGAIELGG